jgi:hypothetical protein
MKVLIGIGIALVIVVAIGAGVTLWVVNAVSRERVSEVATVNAGGPAGRTLVVYHPGLGSFQERVVAAFIDGLVESGWAVDRTTASSEAPSDLSAYDLVVVGSPIYGGKVATPLSDYLARLGDLRGRKVAILLTGAGETPAALADTEAMVRGAGGEVVARIAYTTMRPNESAKSYEGSNIDQAVQMARDAARELFGEVQA